MRRARLLGETRGAAMVEAIFVIPVFILFFIGMVYFRSMYEQKLRIMQLARAAAVGYALTGCQATDPLSQVSTDLKNASDNGSTTQQGSAGTSSSTTGASVGTKGEAGNPLQGSMSDTGVAGDKIADLRIAGPAAGGTRTSPLAAWFGFRATVGTQSFMTCSQQRQDGSIGGAFKYVEGMFKW